MFFVVFGLVACFLRDAFADEYVPSKPVFRPSLGWACWVRRTAGDRDGDGREGLLGGTPEDEGRLQNRKPPVAAGQGKV